MSVRRLAAVASPTALDPVRLWAALEGRDGPDFARRLRAALEEDPRAHELAWERAAFEAIGESDRASREALWREQRMDFAARSDRWSRAPRVCARVATSAGFLFACVAMLESLALPGSLDGDRAASLLFGALDALCIGFVGTSFCAAVEVRSRVAARSALAGAERLLDRLEVIASSSAKGG